MSTAPRPELMALLLEAREEAGRLDGEAIEGIARRLHIPAGRVYGFLTQFPELTRPPQRPSVRVCTGPACAARDALSLLEGLRERLRGAAEVIRDPGLMQPHRAPAVVLQVPGTGERVLEGATADDVEDIARALDRRDLSAYPGVERDIPIPVSRPREAGLSPWLASLQEGGAPPSLTRDTLRRVAHEPEAILAFLEKAGPGCSGALAGSQRAPCAIVCDTIGNSPENSPDLAVALSQPRAVVAGAALAAAAMGARDVVFYLPWDHEGVERSIREAAEMFLADLGIEWRSCRGPVHVPSSRDIGVASVLHGMMIWRAASLCGWHGAGNMEPPLAVYGAASLWQLPWLLDGAAEREKRGEHETALVCVPGGFPRWMELPRHLAAKEAKGLLREGGEKGEPKAVYVEGVAGAALLSGKDFEIPGGARKITVLPKDVCMARWSMHLLGDLEEGCCGGCTPGRTGPSAAARMVMSIVDGRQGERGVAEIVAMLHEAEGLALCPRLGETLPALRACLEDFADDFLPSGTGSALAAVPTEARGKAGV